MKNNDIKILDELEDILETKVFTVNNLLGSEENLIDVELVREAIEDLREELQNVTN